jgi:hypothetical protein
MVLTTATGGRLMSRALLFVALVVLGLEATVVLLGGILDGRWKGAAWMGVLGVCWLADRFVIGPWMTRNPEALRVRLRYSLLLLPLLSAAHVVAQIETWTGEG